MNGTERNEGRGEALNGATTTAIADTKDPAIISRGGWYFRLFLFAFIPFGERVYAEVNGGKPLTWVIFLGASLPAAGAVLGFINKSVPEDTRGQAERKREEVLNAPPPPPTPVVIEQPEGEPVPTRETGPVTETEPRGGNP